MQVKTGEKEREKTQKRGERKLLDLLYKWVINSYII